MQLHREVIDPRNPLLPTYVGLFEEILKVGDDERRILMYIPERARTWGPAIMILPDNGIAAEDALEEGGWLMIADTDEQMEKPILICLEAGKGGWNTEEPYGKDDGDVAYVCAAYLRMMHRSMFAVAESKCYLIGYGAGATLAEMALMYNPAVWAAACAISPMPVPSDYRERAGASICTDLNGFIDETGLGIRKSEMPVPFWMITDVFDHSVDEDIAYWKRALLVDEKAARIAPDTVEFRRSKETDSPLNQDKQAYRFRYTEADVPKSSSGYYFNRRVFSSFFDSIRRWRSQLGGDLRQTVRMQEGLGCEYHYEDVGGWMREWYVYVPDVVRRDPQKAVPLVFAYHGYSCSGEIYAGNSGWHEVADRCGFIVVFPSADNFKIEIKESNMAITPDATQVPAWNTKMEADGPDELLFFDTIFEQVTRDHKIDLSRVYVTGHSMGSMMTFFIGLARSTKLAAIAPCSGVMFWDIEKILPELPAIKSEPVADLPVWMFVGGREEWLMPAVPEGDNISANSIRFWWTRNQMPGSIPDTFEEGWTIYNKIWHELCWQKDGKDMIRYSWLENVPHATMPEMSFRIWEEFFAKLKR